jgi:hypothetical protein
MPVSPSPPRTEIPETDSKRPPAPGGRPYRPFWTRRWVWVAAGLVALVVLAALVPIGGPLRGRLEAKMNQSLKGYTIRLGGAEANLFGLNLTLRQVELRQTAYPEPPLATIPRLRLRLEWTSLLTGNLVGDAFFEEPKLHIDIEQLHHEEVHPVGLGQRGWQAALESIYPLKFNRFRVSDGRITYVDHDPSRPLEITHWDLQATNIRNLQLPDRVYPSPVHTEGRLLGTGWVTIDGNANFLSQPFPAVHALYRLRTVPLDLLEQLSPTYQLRRGTLTSTGEVEYGPRYKRVAVSDVVLDGVVLDYVHAAATDEAERRHAKDIAEKAAKAEASEIHLQLDRLRLLNGAVGFVNHATQPPYRLFFDHANLSMLHISNRAAELHNQPATAELHGRFCGTGNATVKASFRPGEPSSEFHAEIAVDKAALPPLNDFLRAYKKVDVAAGTVSVYMQIAINNRKIEGYIKPLFEDLKMGAPGEPAKPLGTKLKEKVMNGFARVLTNPKTHVIATRTDLSGSIDTPKADNREILSGLFRNAFLKSIVPGFDSAAEAGRPH